MVSIAFWNLNRRPLQDLLATLVKSHAVDLLVLAENTIAPSIVLASLNQVCPGYKTRPWSICTKISVFTRFHASFLQPTEEDERFLICNLRLPARTEILLAMAHLSSKASFDDHSQLAECQLLSKGIRDAESKAGHGKTVVVGDLNVNPFEPPVAGALGLHAVMTRRLAMRNTRQIQNKEYRFFYNPMWRHFGERPDGPPGTYYYGSSGYVTYFWNIFDQVLIRPDLIQQFRDEDLRILTSIGGTSLVGTSGQPSKVGSDHLPMIFNLDI